MSKQYVKCLSVSIYLVLALLGGWVLQTTPHFQALADTQVDGASQLARFPQGVQFEVHWEPQGIDFEVHGDPQGVQFEVHWEPQGIDFEVAGKPHGGEFEIEW